MQYEVIISSHVWYDTISKRFKKLKKLGRENCEKMLKGRLEGNNTTIVQGKNLFPSLKRAIESVSYLDCIRRVELDKDIFNFPYYYLIERNRVERTDVLISLFYYYGFNNFFPLTENIKLDTLNKLLKLREGLQ